MMTFDIAFDRLMGNEGGYTTGAGDPGGETNWGIAKAFHPNVDIKNLTKAAAKVIYRTEFWQPARMDEYDPAIAFQVFDAAVNHGIPPAIKILQRAVGTTPDGVMGPATVAAIKRMSVTDVLMRFIAYRIRLWTSLNTWSRFGAGWANRASDNLLWAAEDA